MPHAPEPRHSFCALPLPASNDPRLHSQSGTPLIYVASVLGHGDTRMVEMHYGHFAPSHVAETIRAKLPTFGIKVDRKVRRL